MQRLIQQGVFKREWCYLSQTLYMKRSFFIAALTLLVCNGIVHAQNSPMPAGAILREAETQAAKENKNVFIIFHASWCGWCHKMDSAMNDASCKALFTNNYVIRHVVVHESPEKKQLENPGGSEMMIQYGGGNGIPYWLVFDKHGTLLADARNKPEGTGVEISGKNTGCPSTKEEIAYFLQVLKKTSSLTPGQLTVVRQVFSK